jgi:hypothetical protein
LADFSISFIEATARLTTSPERSASVLAAATASRLRLAPVAERWTVAVI